MRAPWTTCERRPPRNQARRSVAWLHSRMRTPSGLSDHLLNGLVHAFRVWFRLIRTQTPSDLLVYSLNNCHLLAIVSLFPKICVWPPACLTRDLDGTYEPIPAFRSLSARRTPPLLWCPHRCGLPSVWRSRQRSNMPLRSYFCTPFTNHLFRLSQPC